MNFLTKEANKITNIKLYADKNVTKENYKEKPFIDNYNKNKIVQYKNTTDTSKSSNSIHSGNRFSSEETLNASKFRMLNELLYTTDSKQAEKYFKNHQEDFKVYHEGFSSQATKWPINPNNLIAKELSKKKYLGKVVYDLGCGEAMIARQLKSKNITVKSFDLVATNEYVTVANLSKLPEKNGSCDVAVFCLALMGVNFIEFVVEANRVLVDKGILMIVEISSRIKDENSFITAISEVGFDMRKTLDLKGYFKLFIFRKCEDFYQKAIQKKEEARLKKEANITNVAVYNKKDKKKNSNNTLALKENDVKEKKTLNPEHNQVDVTKIASKFKSVLTPCYYKKR